MDYTRLWPVGKGRSGWIQERMGYVSLGITDISAANIDMGVIGINIIDTIEVD